LPPAALPGKVAAFVQLATGVFWDAGDFLMTFLRLSPALAWVGCVGLFALMGGPGSGAAIAQSSPSSTQPPGKALPPAGTSRTTNDEGVMAPVIQWLERANREYQDTVVQQLSVPTGPGGDASPPKPTEKQAKPVQTAPAEPGIIQQVQEWLGLGGSKPTTNAENAPPSAPITAMPDVGGKPSVTKGTVEQNELEKRAADDAVRRQREARALEAQRAADEQRLTAEAKKAKDAVDQATRERQTIAENARLAEAQRRASGSDTPSKEPAATAAKDAKAAAEAKQAEALARDRAKATADKAAKDKAAELATSEAAKAEAAKSEAGKQAQKAAEAKAPVVPAAPKDTVRTPDAKPEAAKADAKGKSDAQKTGPGPREMPTIATQDGSKTKGKSDSDAREAERLAQAANRAGTSAMEKLAQPRKSHKTTVIGAATASREAKTRGRDGRRCQGAGEDVDPPATYVVKQGDTLWSISRRHYDKGRRFAKIVRANDSKIDDPDLIFPCQKLMLPS
jgi:colicin import membrane protein